VKINRERERERERETERSECVIRSDNDNWQDYVTSVVQDPDVNIAHWCNDSDSLRVNPNYYNLSQKMHTTVL